MTSLLLADVDGENSGEVGELSRVEAGDEFEAAVVFGGDLNALYHLLARLHSLRIKAEFQERRARQLLEAERQQHELERLQIQEELAIADRKSVV